jgi:hypothetical protein
MDKIKVNSSTGPDSYILFFVALKSKRFHHEQDAVVFVISAP